MHQPIIRVALLSTVLLALAACGQPSAGAPATAAPAATEAPAATAPPAPTAAPATEAPAATAAPATATPAATVAPAATAALATVTPVATKAPAATAAPAAATAALPSGAAASPHIQQAIADLAGRLAIDPGAIRVVRAEEVEWPDGSLGCPREDMSYTQALVNGTFVQLEAGGQSYNYHGRGGDAPFLCTSKDELLPEDLPAELRGGGEGT